MLYLYTAFCGSDIIIMHECKWHVFARHQHHLKGRLLDKTENTSEYSIILDNPWISVHWKHYAKNWMLPERETYCLNVSIVCYFIPCSNKNPRGRKVQVGKIFVYVFWCLIQQTNIRYLSVRDGSFLTIINVCPQWSDDVYKWICRKIIGMPLIKRLFKGQVSVIVHLWDKNQSGFSSNIIYVEYILKGTFYANVTFIRCLNTVLWPQCVKTTSLWWSKSTHSFFII